MVNRHSVYNIIGLQSSFVLDVLVDIAIVIASVYLIINEESEVLNNISCSGSQQATSMYKGRLTLVNLYIQYRHLIYEIDLRNL